MTLGRTLGGSGYLLFQPSARAPLRPVNLNHAGIPHHRNPAIRGDAWKALPSVAVDRHSVEFGHQFPLFIGNGQLIDSRFSARLRFSHSHIEGFAVIRPDPVWPESFKYFQILPRL